jgi:predicted DsbA family dithiol-disulfide isomerase
MNKFEVVSDLICPWCYIGKRRLEAALRELPSDTRASVVWRPFQLNPDMPPQGTDRKEYCMAKFGSWARCEEMAAQICEVGKAAGLEFHFELQSIVPNTLDYHRVVWLAEKEEVQDAVVEALFRAYFCEGVNLAKRANLTDVAVSAGLARARVERMFSAYEGIVEVRTEEQEIKALGVTSVPLFIVQELVAVFGAQPPENILQAFEEAQEVKRKQSKTAREPVHPGSGPKGTGG